MEQQITWLILTVVLNGLVTGVINEMKLFGDDLKILYKSAVELKA